MRRFRQAQTEPERTAVFADVVRRHRDAVLGCCAERLWPDADAAVAAAGDLLITARLAMADSKKLPRPDRLRGWLLGIAGEDALTRGLPARIDDINWEAVQARVARDVPEMQDAPARQASLLHWVEQIVATLPEARQQLFDLFVTRGLDSRHAARELGTSAAEVQRLRRENRQAILRAFEVTSLAAGETPPVPPGTDPRGCAELGQLLADARRDGDPQQVSRRHTVVLPAALRLTVTRHLSQCGTCQVRRDDCMARWAPGLLPILAAAELSEQVMEDLLRVPALARPRDTPGAHRRVAAAGIARTAVVRSAAAAAGAGLLVALVLLALAWPGFLHRTPALAPRGSTAPSSQDHSSADAPQATVTIDGVPVHNSARVRTGAAGRLSSLPTKATGSLAVPSLSAMLTPPPAQYAIQPSIPTPEAQPTSGPPSTISPPTPSPSASATQPSKVPSTPPSTSPSPTTPPTSPSPTSTPTTSPSTSPSPTASPSASPSPTPTTSTPSVSASASSTAPPPTLAPSTPATSGDLLSDLELPRR